MAIRFGKAQLDHLVRQQPQRPVVVSLRRFATGDGNQVGALPFIQLRLDSRPWGFLQRTFHPFFDKPLPHSPYCGVSDVQCLGNAFVRQVTFIGLEQNPCSRQGPCSVPAFADQPQQLRSLCFRQINQVLDSHLCLPPRKASAYDQSIPGNPPNRHLLAHHLFDD